MGERTRKLEEALSVEEQLSERARGAGDPWEAVWMGERTRKLVPGVLEYILRVEFDRVRPRRLCVGLDL